MEYTKLWVQVTATKPAIKDSWTSSILNIAIRTAWTCHVNEAPSGVGVTLQVIRVNRANGSRVHITHQSWS